MAKSEKRFYLAEPPWAPWYNLIGKYEGVQHREIENIEPPKRRHWWGKRVQYYAIDSPTGEYAVVKQRDSEVLLHPDASELLERLTKTERKPDLDEWFTSVKRPNIPSIKDLQKHSVVFQGPDQLLPKNLEVLTLKELPGWHRIYMLGGERLATFESNNGGERCAFQKHSWDIYERVFANPGSTLLDACLDEAEAKSMPISDIVTRHLATSLRRLLSSRLAVLDLVR